VDKREVKRETRSVGGEVERRTKNEEGKREVSERGTEEVEDGDN
jgi:GMP synthase-like glutamine amidotransferase